MIADMDAANLRIALFAAVDGGPHAQAVWEVVSPVVAERDELKDRVDELEAKLILRALDIQLDRIIEERDALKARSDAALAVAEKWRADLKQYGDETWAVAARHVCACFLAALADPAQATTEETSDA